MTRRLELLRCRLVQWNREEVQDVFKRLEATEPGITDLQVKKDHEGGLSNGDMVDFQGLLSLHHSLLW